MAKCKSSRCEVTSPKKLKNNGYCDKHQPANTDGPNAAGDDLLTSLLSRVSALEDENRSMRDENRSMRSALKAALGAIDTLYAQTNSQRCSINTSNYERDAIEQYGRLESFRVIDAEEKPLQYDKNGNIIDDEDCTQLAIDAAAVVDVDLAKVDIQRAHRIGRRKKPFVNQQGQMVTPKARQVIVKLKDYSKRLDIVKKKKSFRQNDKRANLKNAFIVEDLTPLRSKLLWYAKHQCNGKFINCHTKNGKILAQTSQSKPNEWISLSNPDEFPAHGIKLDLELINNGLRKMKILDTQEFVPLADLLQ